MLVGPAGREIEAQSGEDEGKQNKLTLISTFHLNQGNQVIAVMEFKDDFQSVLRNLSTLHKFLLHRMRIDVIRYDHIPYL